MFCMGDFIILKVIYTRLSYETLSCFLFNFKINIIVRLPHQHLFLNILQCKLRLFRFCSGGILGRGTHSCHSRGEHRVGIFKETIMGTRNRGGIGLSYRPTRLHRLAKFIPWNRFLGSINV